MTDQFQEQPAPDVTAMNALIQAAAAMWHAGSNFAQAEDPEAYAQACMLAEAGGFSPRIEVTMGDPVQVRGLLMNAEHAPVAVVFEMRAEPA